MSKERRARDEYNATIDLVLTMTEATIRQPTVRELDTPQLTQRERQLVWAVRQAGAARARLIALARVVRLDDAAHQLPPGYPKV